MTLQGVGRRFRFGALGALLLAAAVAADPQALRVQPRTMRPRPELLCVLCTLTVTATPTLVSFTLVKGGVATGSSAVAITTAVYGISLLTNLSLYGYFSSASAALTDGASTPNNIPSSAVLGQVTTGSPTTFTAFTQSNAVGTAGAGLLLYSTSSLPILSCLLAVCRTDNLNLEINLSSLPQLPAGSYNGALILQAQAF